MQLREQSITLEQLPSDLRAGAEKDSCAQLATRINTGLFVFPVLILILWTGTSYPREHLTVLDYVSIALIVGLALRLILVKRHEAMRRKSTEPWLRAIAASVFLTSAPFGLLLAHAAVKYGYSNWNFTLLIILSSALTVSSIVTFAPNYKLLCLHMSGMFVPGLSVALYQHSEHALQSAFGQLALLALSLSQGKRLYAEFWEQSVSRHLEVLRMREIDQARWVAESARISAEETRAKAELAAKARSEFLANMSHEIRTPMNAVMGMTSLILDQDLPAETLSYVNTIRSSSDALLTIINDILDFSKIESGKLDLEREPFRFRECITEVLELLSPRANEKNVALVADPEERVCDWVFGDSGRIRQILLNLVGNALKFTEKGEVTVTVGLKEGLGGVQDLHVAVRDTGIGIPPGRLDALFQSFTQVDASTARRFGGTGLGLAISKRLVNLMGGQIWVTSVLGEGSVFQFVLPYQPVPAQQIPAVADNGFAAGSASTRTPGNGRTIDSGFAAEVPLRILLAEDNPVNQRVAVRLLERLGYWPDAVSDGLEVLQALARRPYDVILMDVQMPEMNGLEATRQIRSQWTREEQPWICALTAGAMKENRDECLAAGVDDFLTKPINVKELQRGLERCYCELSRRAEQLRKPAHEPDPDLVSV